MEVPTTRRKSPPKKGNNGNRKNEKIKQVRDAYFALEKEDGKAPTISKVARVTGISRKTVSKHLEHLK